MTDQKTGVIGCEMAQNPGNFTFFLRFARIYKIFQNLSILPENLIEKAKTGGHWV